MESKFETEKYSNEKLTGWIQYLNGNERVVTELNRSIEIFQSEQ